MKRRRWDSKTKTKIVGHYSGKQARTSEWLEALEKGLNREFPGGVRGKGLKLMSDNGSQPTSLGFMKSCSNLEVQQVFTSYNNPKAEEDYYRNYPSHEIPALLKGICTAEIPIQIS